MNSLRNCKLVNLFKTVRPLKEKRGFGGWSATKIRVINIDEISYERIKHDIVSRILKCT